MAQIGIWGFVRGRANEMNTDLSYIGGVPILWPSGGESYGRNI